jgi:predicted Zn-dependent peptidase
MTVCTTFDNGVQILSRPLPGRRSAALGFWLLNGPRHEGVGQAGYAHLLEHLLFRGGGRYAHHFEALGGHVNARTMREFTAFHGLVTADRVRLLARLFTSLLLEPHLAAADLAAELPAVLREQQLAADAGWEAQEATMLRQVWGAHPLGRPITGGTAGLQTVNASALHAYYSERLNGASLWVVAAGAVDHDGLVESCRALERLPAGARAPQAAPMFTPCARHESLSSALTDLLWVMPVPTLADPAYSAFVLAEQIAAGAPLSARLQCELRERRGFVYAVDSRVELYTDCGLWWIRLQCESGQASACRTAVEAVMADLLGHGPTREEMIRTLAQLQARWTLEEDDPECVLERIAHEIVYLDRVTALNERLASLAVLETEDVRRALASAWRQRASFVWGPGAEDGSASFKENVGLHAAQPNLRATGGASM